LEDLIMDEKKEEQTTLDLDDAMKEGMDKFQGELDEAASEEVDTTKGKEKETSPAGTKEGKPKEEEPSGKKTEHPEKEEEPEKKPEEEPEKKPEEEPEKKPEEEPEKKPEKRFESHEKAEEGYRNLQGEKTKADAEIKKLRDQIEQSEEEEKRKVDAEKVEGDIEEFAIETHEKALTAIDELDPDADEYKKEVATIWSKKDRDIRRFEREHAVEMPSVATPSAGAEKETPEEKELQEARDHVKEVAKEAGLDPEDEFFKVKCSEAPKKDDQGKPMKFDEQLTWAINETKKYHSQIKAPAADEKSKKKQEEELAMGRAGAGKVEEKKEEEKTVSLDDAVESAKDDSRL